MSNDSVVVLQHPSALATKRFSLGPDKRVVTTPYGEGKYFRAETVPLGGLSDLHDLLELLSKDPRAYVIRGELIPGTNKDHCRRLKKEKDGDAPTLREIPRRWLMIDVDSLDPNAAVDWSTPAGCQAAADALLTRLPLELRSAGYIWQCSSSAGMKPGLRMHLWFWLDRPLGEQDLERWGESVNDVAGRKILDVAVFRTIQPLYVANPIFETVLDPVARRIGYVPGPEARLPKLTGKGEIWQRRLEPLYYETNDKIHDHIRDACASFFCSNGPDAEEDALRVALKAGVAKAQELQNRSDYGDSNIEAEIDSGREFARSRVEAGDNLLIDNHGQIKGCLANISSVIAAHEDWRNLLIWNTRVGQIELTRLSPWGSKPGAWNDSIDSIGAVSWFAKEKRMSVDDGNLLRAAIKLAREAEVDPVAQWLSALEWDGVPRLDGWMVGWCGAEDSEYVRRVSRMFMIGAVARALLPGCKHDTVLVLQGATGIGKSMLLEVLGGPWYAAVTDEKDILQKIHGPWFCELPELGPFRFMHYNKIKAFTSTREDRFRAPYMRLPEDRPRSCILAATLNPEGVGWQEDPTSARRFWPVDVHQIDRDAIAAAREQLFAEAVTAFKAGETWWVADAADTMFVERQEAVYARDEWETLMARALVNGGQAFANGGRTINMPPNPQDFHLADLLSVAFGKHVPEKRDQHRAAAILTRLGYTSSGGLWRSTSKEKVLTADAKLDTQDEA